MIYIFEAQLEALSVSYRPEIWCVIKDAASLFLLKVMLWVFGIIYFTEVCIAASLGSSKIDIFHRSQHQKIHIGIERTSNS